MKNTVLGLFLPVVVVILLLGWAGIKLAEVYPLLDALFVSFIAGILVSNTLRVKWIVWTKALVCRNILIPLGLFLYGTQINWLEWFKLNPSTFVISFINVAIYFAVILLCNRFIFRVSNSKLSYLNAGANSICGVSATAVFIPFVDAKEDEVAATLFAIVITGFVSVFLTWNFIQQAANLPLEKYAAFCGLTLNQTGLTKMAAGFMSKDAVKLAVTVKNFRTSLILPMALLLMYLTQAFGSKEASEKMSPEARKKALSYGLLIVLLFFGSSIAFSFTGLHSQAKAIKPFFSFVFCMTMGSVGLLCDFRKILKIEVLCNTMSSMVGWAVVSVATLIMVSLWL